jgi:hypothetical protein
VNWTWFLGFLAAIIRLQCGPLQQGFATIETGGQRDDARQRRHILLRMRDDKFWPRGFEELAEDPVAVSLINEPVREHAPQALRPRARQRSLHAVLCEALTNTQALLARLEAGVHVPRAAAGGAREREVVRELYVQTRRQLKALSLTLELEGLE